MPLRLEIGPRDVKQSQNVAVRRDTGEKITLPKVSADKNIAQLLKDRSSWILETFFVQLNLKRTFLFSGPRNS